MTIAARRMALGIKAQPRLGQAATAMERKSKATRRSASVREVAAMADVYRKVAQAKHSSWGTARRPLPAFITGSLAEAADAVNRSSAQAEATGYHDSRSNGQACVPPLEVALSLTERFRIIYLAGIEESDRPEQTVVFRLVVLIDKALQRFRRIGDQLLTLRTEINLQRTARLDALADQDEWQRDEREATAAAQPKPRCGPAWSKAPTPG